MYSVDFNFSENGAILSQCNRSTVQILQLQNLNTGFILILPKKQLRKCCHGDLSFGFKERMLLLHNNP